MQNHPRLKLEGNLKDKEKEQEQYRPQLNKFYENSFLKTIVCPLHQQPYLYSCTQPTCRGLLCGKIQCVDLHFHNNHLGIDKLNPQLLYLSLNNLELNSAHHAERLKELNLINDNLQDMQRQNEDIQNNIKELKELNHYLIECREKFLTLKFVESIDRIATLGEMVEEGLNQISEKIGLEDSWGRFGSEKTVLETMGQVFEEFRLIETETFLVEAKHFNRRWDIVDEITQPNQGLLTLLFTEDGSLVGEYSSNQNVETGFLFLPSFLFIVQPNGVVKRFPIDRPVLEGRMSERQTGEACLSAVAIDRGVVGSLESIGIPLLLNIAKMSTLVCRHRAP